MIFKKMFDTKKSNFQTTISPITYLDSKSTREKEMEKAIRRLSIENPIKNSISNMNLLDSNKESPIEDTSEHKFRHVITSERFGLLRKQVDDAVREKKTFTVIGGWQRIRNCLLQRGWVERFEYSIKKPVQPTPNQPMPTTSSQIMEDLCSNLPVKKDCESLVSYVVKCEKTIMSRMLQNHAVDFYWNMKREPNNFYHRGNTNQLMNKFGRSLFTSKEGLNLLLQQIHWYCQPGVSLVAFPRCYTLGFPDHYSNFIEDFRITACMSMLKWYSKNYTRGEQAVKSFRGTVPHTAIAFAIDRCNDFIASNKHVDIDKEIDKIYHHEWDLFLSHFYLIVHEHQLLQESKEWQPLQVYMNTQNCLEEIAKIWPMFDLDGDKNIWILKPGNKCRGRGIQLIKHIKDVAKIMELKLKYVVQKYIERPLLVYSTKFDIRQWFMITSTQPLSIWMYRDSYLRFSSQIFDLENFHESLHLTNHAVQCKYTNVMQRDKALPEENMWDCHTFKAYLRSIGHGDKWDSVIFPGMRENIIGTMLACQDTMDRRPNTYELYGADFILGEDFKPWLLEINSSPDLSSSTSVTAKMCPQVLDDLIKVIVDRKKNPDADTGHFMSIYKQNLPRPPAYLGTSLSIRGRRIFKSKKPKKEEYEYEHLVLQDTSEFATKCMPIVLKPGMYKGPIIEDLIVELQNSIRPSSVGYQFANPIVVIPSKKKANTQRVSRVQTNFPKSQDNNYCSVSRRSRNETREKIEGTFTRTFREQTMKGENLSFWQKKGKFDAELKCRETRRCSHKTPVQTKVLDSEFSKLVVVNKNHIQLNPIVSSCSKRH